MLGDAEGSLREIRKTVSIYVRCVAAFAKYFGRSPEELDEGYIREYQRYSVEEKKPSWAL